MKVLQRGQQINCEVKWLLAGTQAHNFELRMCNGIGMLYICEVKWKVIGSLIALSLCLQMWDEHPDVYGVRRSNRSRQEPARLNIGAGVRRCL